MAVDDFASIDRTIAHSFRHFNASIGWLDGHEEQFLRVTLKADLFCVVFDGFDEYVLRNRGEVQPVAVVEALAALAKMTGARILITSRRSFWHANIPEEQIARMAQAGRMHVFEIEAFDQEHAKNYFKQRLASDADISKANRIYGVLRSRNDSVVGRGFVLSLIADLVSRFPESHETSLGEASAMTWLMAAFCEREQLRQQLSLNPAEQLSVFTQFAADVAQGEQASTATLEYALATTRPELDKQTIEGTIDKLKSHPLLEKAPFDDTWSFRQSQTKVLLLAQRVVDCEPGKLFSLVGLLRIDLELRQDLSEAIVDIITAREQEEPAKRTLAGLIQAVGRGSSAALQAENQRLRGAVLMASVERFCPPRGSSHRERSELLVSLSGPEGITLFSFSGSMTRFDLRSMSFKRCVFAQVSWANCNFDAGSTFGDCELHGGNAVYCNGVGLIKFDNCRLDEDAIGWINAAQIEAGKRKYGLEDLKADFAAVASKFILKGGIGLRTIAEANLPKGRVSGSRYRSEILEALKADVIEGHHVSGMSGLGYAVRKEAVEAMRFYATNNVFTGPLSSAFVKLARTLGLK
jgi:hypothetical protein